MKTPKELAEDKAMSAVDLMKLPLKERRLIMEGMVTEDMVNYYKQQIKENDMSEATESLVGDSHIVETKGFRVSIDEVLQRIKLSARTSRERSLAITKLQEAIMWLGMDLKDQGAINPYPNSYNTNNAVIDETADGLKL